MPEPTAGRPDQRYLYEAAVSWYAYAANPSISVALTLPPPDPSEQQNVLLHKIAQSMYEIFDPFSVQPPTPATDNMYLQNIARNAFVIYPEVLPQQGRPDQVLLYIACTNLAGYAMTHAIPMAMAMPNQGDPFNRLLQKFASLAFELMNALP